jgi:hypothetical protein
LHDAYRRHFGKDGDPVLVWRAATREMNSSVPESLVAAALEADGPRARAEYFAEFRSDVESFINHEAIARCVAAGVFERGPIDGVHYVAFLDPAGGSGGDAMALALAHRASDGRSVLDLVREAKPPFSPQAVVDDFAATLKAYRVVKLMSDHWGGEFVREPFRVQGIAFELADRPKSDFYRDLLPLVNSGKVELLDHAKLIAQLTGLERRVSRAGKDSIDHGPGGHDDLSNAAAACLVLAARGGSGKYRYNSTMSWVSDGENSAAAAADFLRMRGSMHLWRASGGRYWG